MILKEDLKKGITVCHTKYQRNYEIISVNARQKDSQMNWIDCIIYAPKYENTYEMFSRETESFLNDFEIVK